MDAPENQEYLRSLTDRIDDLIAAVERVGEDHAEALAKVHSTHRDGALNVLRYAELRTHDLRPLQAGLADFGATRLSTTEPAVLGRLRAARQALGAFNDEPRKYRYSEIADAFARADETLDAHADHLLGPAIDETHSRIMVTLPTEAADDPEIVSGFIATGAELVRINAAHDDESVWLRMVDNVHRAAEEVGREVRIAVDLAGPKLRTGAIAPGPQVGRARVKRLPTGTVIAPSRIWLSPVDRPAPATPELDGRPVLPVQVDAEWLGRMAVGDRISLHDNRGSKRHFTVSEVHADADGEGTPAVLAEGRQNAYIAEGTLLEHDWVKARAHGIPATEQRLRLEIGDTLILTDDPAPVDPAEQDVPRIGCTLPEAVRAIRPGDRVLFDDGVIAGVARETTAGAEGGEGEAGGFTEVRLEITRTKIGGANLAACKGINLPDTDLPVTSLTDEDKAALRFTAAHADIADVSFIRDRADVDTVLAELHAIVREAEEAGDEAAAERARELGVVLKIETVPAYEGLPDIMLAGMQHANFGVMIARGDLAVELGFERLAEVPGLIMAIAEAAHVPTIMATQVLEHLAKDGLPSRAEITDAAFALRAEAVMLNKGPHINQAIEVLSRMSTKLGRSQRKNRMLMRRINSWVPEPEN
ncbi:pyruvate kinase [Corynebacterium frankenforstense]